jgi:gliding motility-associated-like protein
MRTNYLTTYTYVTCLLLCLHGLLHAQNIIPNASFENITTCPYQLAMGVNTQINLASGWRQPTLGSTDYFNTCALQNSGVKPPITTLGYQQPRTGNAYAGIVAYTFTPPLGNADLVREYLQIELSQQLTNGKNYYFEMFVCLSNIISNRRPSANIGAAFTSSPIARLDDGPFILSPQIVSTSFITDTSNWTKIAGSFIANGTEKHLTIGRFGPANAATLTYLPGDAGIMNSYYFIDDVTLVDSCPSFTIPPDFLGSDIDLGCIAKPFFTTLNATNVLAKNYLWSTGETTPTINITDSGHYWVKISDGKCAAFDTVIVSSITKPTFTLGNDTAVCFKKTLTLRPSPIDNRFTYTWIKQVGPINFELATGTAFSLKYAEKIILEANNNGCKGYDTVSVSVSTLDSLILRSDTTLCRQNSLFLNATKTGVTKYKWSTFDTIPIIKTSDNTIYWAEITDGLCISRDSVILTFKGAVKTKGDTIVCGKQNLDLIADPLSTSFVWNTGQNTSSIQVDSGGNYWVTQLKDACITTDSFTIQMDSIPKINLGDDAFICVDPVYKLDAYSPYAKSYLWNTTETSSFILIQDNGRYSVTAYGDHCSFTDAINLRTQVNTPFSFGADKTDCFDSEVLLTSTAFLMDSYLWSTGETTPSISIKTPGKYWLRAEKGICFSYDTIELFEKKQPYLKLPEDTIICLGMPFNIEGIDSGTIVQYDWNNGQNSKIATIDYPGLFILKVTNEEGCSTKDSIELTSYPAIKLFNTDKAYFCENDSVLLIPMKNLSSYKWQDGSSNPTYYAQTENTFWVSAIDTLGCLSKDSIVTIKNKLPNINMDTFILTCDLNFVLEPQEIYQRYTWQDGSSNAQFKVTDFGTFYVTVTDNNGCKNKIETIVQNNCPPSVEVSNVFSPNADGLNDVLIPKYEHIIETHFVIYNRWGLKIFETNNVLEGWDGKTQQAFDADNGVYYFVLTCKGISNQVFNKNGTITLIR